jgi:hypothetical protein
MEPFLPSTGRPYAERRRWRGELSPMAKLSASCVRPAWPHEVGRTPGIHKSFSAGGRVMLLVAGDTGDVM